MANAFIGNIGPDVYKTQSISDVLLIIGIKDINSSHGIRFCNGTTTAAIFAREYTTTLTSDNLSFG